MTTKNKTMKKSELSFADGFNPAGKGQINKAKGIPEKVFDWDQAAQHIKLAYKDHSDLTAEAGLQGDWDYTGGEIFSNGEPNNQDHTYLSSNWATPTLILSWDGLEQKEIECCTLKDECRFESGSKWDDESLKILGIIKP